MQFYLQTAGPETAMPFHPPQAQLAYALPEFDLAFPYSPTEFTQVNAPINRVLVRRAMALLAPQPGERIADFFCGLGNFTLPIARRGATVIGVEGSVSLVRRAESNAVRNGLGTRASFAVANLFEATPESLEALGPIDKALLDPPREGAVALVKALPGDGAPRPDRLRLVQPGDPRARRVDPGPRPRLCACRRRGRQHVSAHRPRRVDRAVRALTLAPAQTRTLPVPV